MSGVTSKTVIKDLPSPIEPGKHEKKQALAVDKDVTWSGWSAVIVAIIIYLAAQLLVAGAVYLVLNSFSGHLARAWFNWLDNDVVGQFVYYLIAESLTVAGIIGFIRRRKGSLAAIGLKRPKLEDIPYAFVGLVIYLPLLIIGVTVLKFVFPGLNLGQQQAVGFSTTTTGWPLVLVFLSLVVMPPIAEEIMFRGFVYSGLKRSLPKVWAVLLTCCLFAAPHLLESAGGGGLLWVAGIDTFVLSLTLIWLREKTGRLYAGMGLHGLKNFIAFLQLYPILHIHW
jgi:membrane protease YdiL (CAAX protease family)